MKTIFLFGRLLLLTAVIISCSKKDKPAGPGPNPGPDPGSGPTTLERTGAAELSAARKGLLAAAAGNKILFAGGIYGLSHPAAVDIYDVSTKTWSTSALTIARENHAMTAAGNKIFVAGGTAFYNGLDITSSVEIYDVTTGKWTNTSFSTPRHTPAAAGLQNKAFFGGGGELSRDSACCVVSNRVEIYDVATGKWSQSSLSIPRDGVAAAAIGNKVVFAGGLGHSSQTGGFFSSRVDIYDITKGTWSTAELSQARTELYAAAAGNKILFAGGRYANLGNTQSKVVDIYDVSTGKWSVAELSADRQGASIAAIGNKIVIAGGYSKVTGSYLSSVDVYDTSTDKWDKLELSEARMEGAAAGINNILLIGGGFTEFGGFSKAVDIFTLSK